MLQDAVASNWIAPLGPHVDGFEAEMAARIDVPHALALSSGTAALHLALEVLGVGRGDEVWCSTLTFAATANAVTYVGATPVFVDSDLTSWNMDPALLAQALDDAAKQSALPKAVIAVDLYGQCADLEPIAAACRRHGVFLIEDAAEALGATYRGRPAGSFGDLSILSFNGNKIITTSGGGMLACRDRAWVEKARFWSQQAREPARHYEHKELGFNYRMSNVIAGIGRGQLAVLEERVAARRAIAFRYASALGDLPGLQLMPQATWGRHTNWLSIFLVDEVAFGASRDAILDALAREDIEGRPVWKPMHLQPFYSECEAVGGSVAEDLFRRGICLPSSSSLAPEEQDRVIEIIRSVHRSGEDTARPREGATWIGCET
jgi:pyridoxal phosphate-dependent aminotransferase EpsN